MELWQVTRFCCLSGMCFTCRAIVTGGARKRILVAENITQEKAERLAGVWAEYGGEASEMPLANVTVVVARFNTNTSAMNVAGDSQTGRRNQFNNLQGNKYSSST